MTSIRTTKSSILKNFESRGRDQIKNAIANRVRFELLTHKRLHQILMNVETNAPNSVRDYNQYLSMIRDEHLSDTDFLSAIQESKECIELLIKYEDMAKALISLDWTKHDAHAVDEYQSFVVDLLSSHNKFVKTAVGNMVAILLPKDTDEAVWTDSSTPVEQEQLRIQSVLNTLKRILDIIPLSVHTLIKACAEYYPFYTVKPFIYAGYFRNMLEVMRLHPSVEKQLLTSILTK